MTVTRDESTLAAEEQVYDRDNKPRADRKPQSKLFDRNVEANSNRMNVNYSLDSVISQRKCTQRRFASTLTL